MKLGVIKEPHANENRVSIIPETIAKLAKLGLEVLVEQGAGESSHLSNEAYEESGAKILNSASDVFSSSDLVVKIGDITDSEETLLRQNQLLIGFLNPLGNPERIKKLTDTGASLLSMELIPRTSRAQSMDALSSQASIAGYQATLMTAVELPKYFPMLTTAAGTIAPAKVFIVGAGVAGLQAIATAKRLGAVVEAFDVRPAVKEECQSLGAKFVEIELSGDTATKGGYAKELSEEDKRKTQELLKDTVAASDVVITTAQVPGKTAPRIITEEMLFGMKPGSVVLDMAVNQGGNVAHSKPGENVIHNGVKIMGPLNLPSMVPFHASQLYSRNVFNLLKLMLTDEGKFNLNFDDDILNEAVVSHEGVLRNERIKGLL